ncbi:MAG: transporter [Methyloligella sp.]|nr:MAG: transporter [Methyloligella sp.]
MQTLISLIAGLIFGYGLVLSGMSNPAKVMNFLDITGSFDPSLIFVMLGAVVTTFIGYRLVWRMERPFVSGEFQRPLKSEIDGRLIVGPILFGVGWGLIGLCPGPALASLTFGGVSALIFFIALIIGMMVSKLIVRFI